MMSQKGVWYFLHHQGVYSILSQLEGEGDQTDPEREGGSAFTESSFTTVNPTTTEVNVTIFSEIHVLRTQRTYPIHIYIIREANHIISSSAVKSIHCIFSVAYLGGWFQGFHGTPLWAGPIVLRSTDDRLNGTPLPG